MRQSLCDCLQTFCAESASIVSYCLFFNTDGNLCLVCDAPDASRLTRFISVWAEGRPVGTVSVFWGNNKSIRNIYGISRRIAHVAAIRIVRNCSAPAFIKTIEALPGLNALLHFANCIRKVLDDAILENQEGMRRKLSELEKSPGLRETFQCVDRHVLQTYLTRFFGVEIVFRTCDELLTQLENQASRMRGVSLAQTFRDVEQIRDYVRVHYAEDVSISGVSELFHLSPSYLSRLFHEKTGQGQLPSSFR